MKLMIYEMFFAMLIFSSPFILAKEASDVNFSIEYEKEFVDGKTGSRNFNIYVSSEFFPVDLFEKYKREKALCYSVEIMPQDMKKKMLVIWYENAGSLKKSVFFDFPFPLAGILSFYMNERKDHAPIDAMNDIKAVAEIFIQEFPGRDSEELEVTYFHLESNGFFTIKTTMNMNSSLSAEKIPLYFGRLGHLKNRKEISEASRQ